MNVQIASERDASVPRCHAVFARVSTGGAGTGARNRVAGANRSRPRDAGGGVPTYGAASVPVPVDGGGGGGGGFASASRGEHRSTPTPPRRLPSNPVGETNAWRLECDNILLYETHTTRAKRKYVYNTVFWSVTKCLT